MRRQGSKCPSCVGNNRRRGEILKRRWFWNCIHIRIFLFGSLCLMFGVFDGVFKNYFDCLGENRFLQQRKCNKEDEKKGEKPILKLA